jgi:hypothetical protein
MTGDSLTFKKLHRLARHKTRIERTLYRSLKEIKASQPSAVIEATLLFGPRQNIPPLSFSDRNFKTNPTVRETR